MEERKKCETCGLPLIAFEGHYLHPQVPCNGIIDYIDIDATIRDEFLHEEFKKLYGNPELNDYDRLNKIYSNWFFRFFLKLFV